MLTRHAITLMSDVRVCPSLQASYVAPPRTSCLGKRRTAGRTAARRRMALPPSLLWLSGRRAVRLKLVVS
jgi:hypothetical protein